MRHRIWHDVRVRIDTNSILVLKWNLKWVWCGGSKLTWFQCWDRHLLSFCAGGRSWLRFCLRTPKDLVLVYELNVTFYIGSKMTWFCVRPGPQMTCFLFRYRLTWFLFRCHNRLVFVFWPKMTWFCCGHRTYLGLQLGGRNYLDLGVMTWFLCGWSKLIGLMRRVIEIDLFLCSGRKWHYLSEEIDSLGFCVGGRNWHDVSVSVWGSTLTWFQCRRQNWYVFCVGGRI